MFKVAPPIGGHSWEIMFYIFLSSDATASLRLFSVSWQYAPRRVARKKHTVCHCYQILSIINTFQRYMIEDIYLTLNVPILLCVLASCRGGNAKNYFGPGDTKENWE